MSLDDPILLLDGATGTELDRHGADISLPLWSARALLDAPSLVERIHMEYLEAGASAIVTNTFRTHRRSLDKADLGDRARELTKRAVDLALLARDRVNPRALVLGSVAPLEDCYHPELAPNEDVCKEEHAEMITHLVDDGVDLVLIETATTRHEALAAAEVAQRLAPGKWMISFCTKTVGPPGVLLHGASLIDVLPFLEDAVSVGVNCIDATKITPQVELLRTLLPEHVRISAYGNIGCPDETGKWINSDAVEPERYADYAEEWIAAGATVVGGCCGTTPEIIQAIRGRL